MILALAEKLPAIVPGFFSGEPGRSLAMSRMTHLLPRHAGDREGDACRPDHQQGHEKYVREGGNSDPSCCLFVPLAGFLFDASFVETFFAEIVDPFAQFFGAFADVFAHFFSAVLVIARRQDDGGRGNKHGNHEQTPELFHNFLLHNV